MPRGAFQRISVRADLPLMLSYLRDHKRPEKFPRSVKRQLRAGVSLLAPEKTAKRTLKGQNAVGTIQTIIYRSEKTNPPTAPPNNTRFFLFTWCSRPVSPRIHPPSPRFSPQTPPKDDVAWTMSGLKNCDSKRRSHEAMENESRPGQKTPAPSQGPRPNTGILPFPGRPPRNGCRTVRCKSSSADS